MTKKELQEKIYQDIYQEGTTTTAPFYKVWQDRPYTAVQLDYYCGCWYCALGFTKVTYPDRWDADYGVELALRKAAAKIARRILESEES